VGLLHQKLSSGWERAGRTGVGADHIDHQVIVLVLNTGSLIPIGQNFDFVCLRSE
jgi:hypothetical protein